MKTAAITNKTTLPRRSFFLIGLAIGMSCITLIWFSFTSVATLYRIKDVEPAIHRAKELQGMILRLDEVLTMSARLYVVTDDERWKKRYDDYEPQLNQSINQLNALIIKQNWQIEKDLVKKTHTANKELVAMERRAFDLVQQGHFRAAKQLLFSPQYEKQKKIYFSSMALIFNTLDQKAKDELAKNITEVHIKLVYILIATVLLILIWTSFFRAYHRWKKALDSSIEANGKYEKDLLAAKAVLEDTVQQRTATLQASNHQLTVSLNQVHALQQAVIQTEKMAVIGQLAGGIAHEINNPLSFVMTNMNALKSELTLVAQLLTMFQNLMNEVTIPANPVAVAKQNADVPRLVSGIQKSSYEARSLDPAYKPRDVDGWIEPQQDGQVKIDHNDTLIHLCHQIDQFNQDNQIPALMKDFDSLISESTEGLTRIKRIVSNLSEFSQMHREATEPINVNVCIEAAIELVWNKLKYKTTLHKNLTDLPLINASKHQLELVFMNLLLNAAEAITAEGEITIASKEVDSTIVVTVSDNGCGIAPDVLSKLFTPFFSKNTLADNLHLGLSASYAIVQLHGGNMTVESSVGQGSTFTVTLPVRKTET